MPKVPDRDAHKLNYQQTTLEKISGVSKMSVQNESEVIVKRRARCGYEYCCNEATWHIDQNGYGYCGQHHNYSYSWAGQFHYYKPEECYQCQKEGKV
jgi:hypothetical protein